MRDSFIEETMARSMICHLAVSHLIPFCFVSRRASRLRCSRIPPLHRDFSEQEGCWFLRKPKQATAAARLLPSRGRPSTFSKENL